MGGGSIPGGAPPPKPPLAAGSDVGRPPPPPPEEEEEEEGPWAGLRAKGPGDSGAGGGLSCRDSSFSMRSASAWRVTSKGSKPSSSSCVLCCVGLCCAGCVDEPKPKAACQSVDDDTGMVSGVGGGNGGGRGYMRARRRAVGGVECCPDFTHPDLHRSDYIHTSFLCCNITLQLYI